MECQIHFTSIEKKILSGIDLGISKSEVKFSNVFNLDLRMLKMLFFAFVA